ncbi:AraC family ligand binding domain-containing protein [Paenibacillus rhizoplanae]
MRSLYKIHFIHAGTGKVTVGEATHTLGAGQAFLTYPHVVTHYAADQDDPWLYSWIAFTGEEAGYLLARTSLTPEQPVFPMDPVLMPSLSARLSETGSSRDLLDLPLKVMLYEFFSPCCCARSRLPTARLRAAEVSMSSSACITFKPTTPRM